MSERIIGRPGRVAGGDGVAPERFNLLEVEDVARGMIRRARRTVEELTRTAASLEEEYRARREELALEYKARRDGLEAELAGARRRAEEELDALGKEVKEKAREEGFEQGYGEGLLRGREDGLAAGREEGRRAAEEATRAELGEGLSRATACLREIVSSLDARRASLLRDAEREVLALAVSIAEKIVRHEIRTCPDVVLRSVGKALEIVSQRTGATVEVNPDDLAHVEAHAEGVLDVFRESPGLRLVGNPHVERGGCMVSGAGAGVDLRIGTQLELVEQALLGEDARDTVST